MDYQTIELEIAAGVARLTLNRPEVKNALNSQMRAEIPHAVKVAQDQARVLVITGAGDAFCSGQDLGGNGSAASLDIEQVLRDEYTPMVRAILDCPIPTIAAVNGAAAGAGANLALAADVVIASERAVFLQAFTRIGLIPDAGGTYWLPRQIGSARAMGAALFSEPIPARQAADWGMIWEAVPDAEFSDHVTRRADHLANGPTLAYAMAKQALRGTYDHTLDQQMLLEAELQGRCGKTRDFAEGVVAFLEKRPAQFEGR
ncbi:enoyl-CoA hydratase-related protein [Pseudoruegeria sp. SK021]|uniref:enoyl-CoA hydratase-related protein n=1 Tax=Pseudoruegeria sp. SK021 TaxID=1933035 RepID=UPI000A24D907|nr:enoyl-CoA hydratase-related protein [Pseudoruegeria sp. SK021]OSP55537.1 2-(1,2-epoxy-1,2-dihydrophenyl)acetyl-CoA isomerase [Pseudoruegeria sp. SK021]